MHHHRVVAALCALVMIIAGVGVGRGLTAQGNVLTIGISPEPITLDASQNTGQVLQSVVGQIGEQLIYFDAQGKIAPQLATDWKWVAPTILEMHLRRGISFSNGEPLNADAVKFSLQQYSKSPVYVPALFGKGVYQDTEIVDDYTVRIHLTRPFTSILSALARSVEIFPPKYYQSVGPAAYGQRPIGTGPFVLSQWSKGESITLTRNPTYSRGTPAISRIVFRIIPDDTARVAALQRGEIDIAYLLPTTVVGRLRQDRRVRVFDVAGMRKFAVHFDTVNGPEPLRDARVRQALNYAVDKEALIARVYNGEADPLPGQWLLPQESGYKPLVKEFKYDPARAKELLKAAGYPNGFALQINSTVGRYPSDKEQAEVVAAYIEQAGIRVEQRPMEFGSLETLWHQHKAGTHLWGLLVTPDPYFNLSLFQTGSIFEYHPMGAEFNRLLSQGLETTVPAKQRNIYQRMEQIMHDDPPMLYLVAPRDVYGTTAQVKGFAPRPDQVLFLSDVSVAR